MRPCLTWRLLVIVIESCVVVVFVLAVILRESRVVVGFVLIVIVMLGRAREPNEFPWNDSLRVERGPFELLNPGKRSGSLWPPRIFASCADWVSRYTVTAQGCLRPAADGDGDRSRRELWGS